MCFDAILSHFLSCFCCKCLISSELAHFGVSFVAIQGAFCSLDMNQLLCIIVAMKTKSRRVHLEIQQHRGNPVGLIRSSFRKDGKVYHATYGRITGLSLEQLRLIQAAFQRRVVPGDSPEALQITSGREYGASAVGLALAKELGLDRIIYSRSERWVRCALALIVGRLVYAGSELALSHIGDLSALWELCGVSGPIDVDRDCYAVMDRLLERQGAIQRSLAARHLQDGCLVLYDLTSSYVEWRLCRRGESSK